MVEGPMRYVAKGAARSAGGAFSLVCWAVRGLLLATDRPFAALRDSVCNVRDFGRAVRHHGKRTFDPRRVSLWMLWSLKLLSLGPGRFRHSFGSLRRMRETWPGDQTSSARAAWLKSSCMASQISMRKLILSGRIGTSRLSRAAI